MLLVTLRLLVSLSHDQCQWGAGHHHFQLEVFTALDLENSLLNGSQAHLLREEALAISVQYSAASKLGRHLGGKQAFGVLGMNAHTLRRCT